MYLQVSIMLVKGVIEFCPCVHGGLGYTLKFKRQFIIMDNSRLNKLIVLFAFN